jgi:hypothetical protein
MSSRVDSNARREESNDLGPSGVMRHTAISMGIPLPQINVVEGPQVTSANVPRILGRKHEVGLKSGFG